MQAKHFPNSGHSGGYCEGCCHCDLAHQSRATGPPGEERVPPCLLSGPLTYGGVVERLRGRRSGTQPHLASTPLCDLGEALLTPLPTTT